MALSGLDTEGSEAMADPETRAGNDPGNGPGYDPGNDLGYGLGKRPGQRAGRRAWTSCGPAGPHRGKQNIPAQSRRLSG
jgi:hypothetical protein